jgi:hypothetical protein
LSYLTYALLTEDVNFGRRSRACINETANSLNQDSNPAIAALATDLLKQEGLQTVVMLNSICAGPNFSELVDNGDGTIDSTKISDEDIKAHTQAMFTEVAWIFYPDKMPSGTPLPPSVDAVDPTSGPNGTPITLTGVSLSGTTKVALGGTTCTDLNVDSDTQVTAVTPSGPNKGARSIVVTVDGTDVSGPSFQVT